MNNLTKLHLSIGDSGGHTVRVCSSSTCIPGRLMVFRKLVGWEQNHCPIGKQEISNCLVGL